MDQKEYELQVKIEHRKLQIKHYLFLALEIIFAMLTWCIIPIEIILSSVMHDNLKSFTIAAFASLLYFAITLGLTLLFQKLAFENKDDFVLIPHFTGYVKFPVVEEKMKSEVLAERKLRSRKDNE